jgi:succinoglycan biosynthesis protein ExoM
MLSTLIANLQHQTTENLFTYSAVIVDNDVNRSAEKTVQQWQTQSTIRIDYYNQPEQNIALTRNKAVDNAAGDFIAFIDDDEFPEATWLLNLFKTLQRYKADAVLGPVRPYYVDGTPKWLIKSKLCERPSYPTGTRLPGRETRTGNVLLSKSMFQNPGDRFDPAFGRTGSEDTNYFRMMEKKGRVYVWCEEAPAYETVPPERWTTDYYTTRSFRIGGMAGRRIRRNHSIAYSLLFLVKSTVYVIGTGLLIPVAWVLGKHVYIRIATRLVYNVGLMSSLAGKSMVHDRAD